MTLFQRRTYYIKLSRYLQIFKSQKSSITLLMVLLKLSSFMENLLMSESNKILMNFTTFFVITLKTCLKELPMKDYSKIQLVELFVMKQNHLRKNIPIQEREKNPSLPLLLTLKTKRTSLKLQICMLNLIAQKVTTSTFARNTIKRQMLKEEAI